MGIVLLWGQKHIFTRTRERLTDRDRHTGTGRHTHTDTHVVWLNKVDPVWL